MHRLGHARPAQVNVRAPRRHMLLRCQAHVLRIVSLDGLQLAAGLRHGMQGEGGHIQREVQNWRRRAAGVFW